MGNNNGIEWTDATLNLVGGCDKVSPGCENCYAIGQSFRQEHFYIKNGGAGSHKYVGTVKNGEWTGNINVNKADIKREFAKLNKTKPQKVFINSMSDLFHPKVPDTFILNVMDEMVFSPHIFQLLTKRPKLAYKFFSGYLNHNEIQSNVWLGTTLELQKYEQRIVDLLRIPAAKRFVSCEPLLGKIDLTSIGKWKDEPLTALEEIVGHVNRPALDWVIIGCESGHNRRPCNLDWVYSLVDQCQNAGVKVFVKQYVENGKIVKKIEDMRHDLQIQEFPL